MSLINQMLKDLDARRASDTPQPGVQVSGGAGSRPRRVWPAVLLSVAVTTLTAAGLWWWLAAPGEAASPRPANGAPAHTVAAGESAPRETAKPAIENAAIPEPAGEITAGTEADTPTPATAAPTDTETGTPQHAPPDTPAVDTDDNSTPAAASEPPSKAVRQHSVPASHVAEKSVPPPAESGSMHKAPSQPKPAAQARSAYAEGRERLRRGDAAGAVRAWRRALAADSSFHPAREALATELVREGRTDAAAALLREGMQQYPEHAAYGERLARLQLAADDPDAAAATLAGMPAPDLDADRDYYALLAAARQRSGDDAGAITVYRQLTAADSDNAAWWVGLALSLERSHRAEAARQAYQRALQSPQRSATLEQFARQRLSQLPASTQ